MSKIFIAMALAGTLCLAGSKDKDWQTAKVLDPVYNPYFGSTDAAGNYVVPASAPETTHKVNSAGPVSDAVADTYVIETEDAVYRIERTHFRMSPEANVKSYTKIRFAVVKNRLWIEDGDGKQWSTKILEKKNKS